MSMRIASLIASACGRPVIALARWMLRIRSQRRGDISLTCTRFAVLLDAGSNQQAVLNRLTAGLAPGMCRVILTPPPTGRLRFPAYEALRRGAVIAQSLRVEGPDALVACTASPVDSVA